MHIGYRPIFRRIAALSLLSFCLLTTEGVSAASIRQAVYARTVRRLAKIQNIPRRVPLTATTLRPYLVMPVRRAARSSSRSVSSAGATRPTDPLRAELLRLVNAERANAGLHPLTMHPLLEESAQLYAEDMVARKFFSHRDPDGRNSLDRIRSVGYLTPPCDCSWRYMTGENLGRGQATAAQIVHDWMNSPSHRDNILHREFKDIGIGYKNDHWVQNFGLVEAR